MITFSDGFGLATHTHKEQYYQEKWSSEHDGQSEVLLPDKARAGCVISTHAIEFDFGTKWAESLRLALYYFFKLKKGRGLPWFWRFRVIGNTFSG